MMLLKMNEVFELDYPQNDTFSINLKKQGITIPLSLEKLQQENIAYFKDGMILFDSYRISQIDSLDISTRIKIDIDRAYLFLK